METPVEIQGLVTAGVIIASVVIGVLAYMFKRPEVQSATSIRGAAIIDSSIGREMVEVLRELVEVQNRTAVATDSLYRLMMERERTIAAQRDRAEVEGLRRQIEQLQKTINRGNRPR